MTEKVPNNIQTLQITSIYFCSNKLLEIYKLTNITKSTHLIQSNII